MHKSNTREHVTVAKRYFAERQYERCEPLLRKIVQEQSAFADAHNMLGVIYHAWGRFADAITSFEKALAQNPKYTEAMLNLSVLLNDLGRYKDAKKIYTNLRAGAGANGKKKSGTQIEPVLKGKLSNMHAELGDIYSGLGLYPQAAAEYERALVLNPEYVDILTKLGTAQREMGHPKESIDSFRKVLKLRPTYYQARVQLGLTFLVSGKKKDANKEWNAVLESDPQNPSAKMYLSLCE